MSTPFMIMIASQVVEAIARFRNLLHNETNCWQSKEVFNLRNNNGMALQETRINFVYDFSR